MSDQHAGFIARLAGSSRAVFVLANYLHNKGYIVEIPAVQLRESAVSAEVAQNYVDGGDLFVVTRKRYEVKHRNIAFTNQNDFPFNTVFISSVEPLERANNAVAAYIIINKDLTHAAVVDQNTRPHWYQESNFTSNTGNLEKMYVCPIQHVKFLEL